MGQELKRDELVGMVENLLEMCNVEEMIDAVQQAVLNKEAYCKLHWPDQPETFGYYERMHPILMAMLGSASDLGKEIKAKAEEERLARLEEAVASRAAQDAEFEARNAAATAADKASEQEAIDALKAVSSQYLFHAKLATNAGDTNLLVAFVDKTFWANNQSLDSNSLDDLTEALDKLGFAEIEEGVYEVDCGQQDPDPAALTKVEDFLRKTGFGNDPAFEAFVNSKL